MTLTPSQLLEGMARAYTKSRAKKDSDAMKDALRYLIDHAGECEELTHSLYRDLPDALTVLVEGK